MSDPGMVCEPGQRAADAVAPALEQLLLTCLGRLLLGDPREEPVTPEQHYVWQRLRAFPPLADLGEAMVRCRARPREADAPLLKLAAALGLSDEEILAVALALRVEEEAPVGRVLAHLQAPLGGSRPTLGLLSAAFAPLSGGAWLPGDWLDGAAVSHGVLRVLDDRAPLPERAVAIPLGLAQVLRGRALNWPGHKRGVSAAVRLPLSVTQALRHYARLLRQQRQAGLLIRAAAPEERRAVAAALAGQLRRTPLFLDLGRAELAGLGAVCQISAHLPVFELGGTGDEAGSAVPALSGYSGPWVLLAGLQQRLNGAWQGLWEWRLEAPPRPERQRLWQAYLGDGELAAQLARAHPHSAGRIAELAQAARREARLRGRKQPRLADIRRAAWHAAGDGLEHLAQPLPGEVSDQALVAPAALRADLAQLLAHCRQRESLGQALGESIQARQQAGVRCLLVGPSGTGKTLAALWLASRLGLPLYRADLAALVSKYIGETEKNLAELLSRAEHHEIVLLFDEADALFGKRTDIKDANDRFANSQTNYLLQRMEYYRGIVLLTSNSRDRFDGAFTRRLDRIVEFPLPGPRERRALWRSHLGEGHALDGCQINQLAAVCDLAGGHIRNAVLAAAVRAGEEERRIGLADVLHGLADEYRKLGRQFPAQLQAQLGRAEERA